MFNFVTKLYNDRYSLIHQIKSFIYQAYYDNLLKLENYENDIIYSYTCIQPVDTNLRLIYLE